MILNMIFVIKKKKNLVQNKKLILNYPFINADDSFLYIDTSLMS